MFISEGLLCFDQEANNSLGTFGHRIPLGAVEVSPPCVDHN